MTGVELEKYLKSLHNFKDENVYMIEVIDGNVYNVQSHYKMNLVDILEISLYYRKDKVKCVEFSLTEFGGRKQSVYHELDKLDFLTLKGILCQFFNYTDITEWSRHWQIENILGYNESF
jgi:hypothetical protein